MTFAWSLCSEAQQLKKKLWKKAGRASCYGTVKGVCFLVRRGNACTVRPLGVGPGVGVGACMWCMPVCNGGLKLICDCDCVYAKEADTGLYVKLSGPDGKAFFFMCSRSRLAVANRIGSNNSTKLIFFSATSFDEVYSSACPASGGGWMGSGNY